MAVMTTSRSRKALALVTLSLLAAACGSRAAPERQQADSGTGVNRDGLGLGPTGADGSIPDAFPGGGGTVALGGTSADGGAASGNSSSGAGSTTIIGQPPSRTGGAAPLKIGVVIATGNPGAAFGIQQTSDTNEIKNLVHAMVKHVNETGGFAGHPIQAVIAEVDKTDESEATQIREENAACARLTQDERVFMVLGFGAEGWALGCYAKHRTPLLQNASPSNETLMKGYRPWLLPTFGLNHDRWARAIALAMDEQNTLTKKMAVVTWDYDISRPPADNVLIPEIERRGGKVIDREYLKVDYAGIAAGIANAVLRFKAAGVDRVVLFTCCGGGGHLIFTQQAESQQYRPGYAISTYDSPAFLIPLLPAGQRSNLSGPGWQMLKDVSTSQHPPPTAAEKACWAIINKKTGSNYQNRSDGAAEGALVMCDQFLLVQRALRPATGQPLTQPDVPRLFYRVGRYQPIRFESAIFDAHRFDALTSYALLRWDNGDCQCMKYASGWREMPF